MTRTSAEEKRGLEILEDLLSNVLSSGDPDQAIKRLNDLIDCIKRNGQTFYAEDIQQVIAEVWSNIMDGD